MFDLGYIERETVFGEAAVAFIFTSVLWKISHNETIEDIFLIIFLSLISKIFSNFKIRESIFFFFLDYIKANAMIICSL